MIDSNAKLRQAAILKWMTDVITTDSWKNFDDLHVDSVDRGYRAKDRWLEAALMCLSDAIILRDENRFPFVVELRIVLQSGRDPIGMNFATYSDLKPELGYTPPSLYLFEVSSDIWRQASAFGAHIVLPGLPSSLQLKSTYIEMPSEYDVDMFRAVAIDSVPQ